MRQIRHWTVCLALVMASTLSAHAQSSPGTLAVIVHPDNEITDLSYPELRRILRLDRQYWRPGTPISLMVPGPSASERERALDKAFQMSEQGFRQHWIAVAYRVQALNLPRPYSDCSVAVRVVSSLKTAMAIVDQACVQDAAVRIVMVDGKKPGTAGYRL